MCAARSRKKNQSVGSKEYVNDVIASLDALIDPASYFSLPDIARRVAPCDELDTEERRLLERSANQLAVAGDELKQEILKLEQGEFRTHLLYQLSTVIAAAYVIGKTAEKNAIVERIAKETIDAATAHARKAREARTRSREINETVLEFARVTLERHPEWTDNRITTDILPRLNKRGFPLKQDAVRKRVKVLRSDGWTVIR
jgi:hypothetical protein